MAQAGWPLLFLFFDEAQQKHARINQLANDTSNLAQVGDAFRLLVNEMGPQGNFRLASRDRSGGPGCIFNTAAMEMRLLAWCDVLHEARLRYQFFRDSLKIEPSGDVGMSRFKQAYRHLMMGKGMTKKGEREVGKLKSQRRSG